MYSAPCDLRPVHVRIPSILRPAISTSTLIFSKYRYISFCFKATFRTLTMLKTMFAGWTYEQVVLKMQGPLLSHTYTATNFTHEHNYENLGNISYMYL